MKGLTAETTHGDLDLSFGSVIRDHWSNCMVLGVEHNNSLVAPTLRVRVVTLSDTRALPGAWAIGRPAFIPWSRIDDYEQVS